MRPLLASFPILLGVGLLCFAAGPPTTPVVLAARAADQLDYLFLGSDRPTLIRLHLRVGDRPYGAAWVEFMDKLFAWFDKDKDGFLSATESSRLPSAFYLFRFAQGGIGQPSQGVPFATIDTNKDGKVSKEEFRAYYRNAGFPDFALARGNDQATAAKRINDTVFKRLDKSGGGRLTAEKVAGMYEKLRALDQNEDEMLDQAELNTGNNRNAAYADATTKTAFRLAPVAVPSLLELDPGREATLVTQLMKKYDRNKDGKLTPAEIGLSAARFARLDANKDGTLDIGELGAYLASPPDLVLRLQVGTPVARKGLASLFPVPRLVVVNEKILEGAMKKTFRRAGSDSIAVELGDTRVALQAAGSDGRVRRFDRARQYYVQQYDTIAGKKGYIERDDGKGQQPFLFQIFSQADKNADGKLTGVELVEWLDLVTTGQDAKVTITAYDLGRGIFPFLDADGDGRLSLREMKTAWARLEPLAKDGKVTQTDIPRSLRIIVRQGQLTDNILPVPVATGRGSPTRPANRASAPDWFRKMDKNNDGDISPREWLGTDEEFEAIDADGDGLISAAEAIAFEAKKKTIDKE